MKQNGAPDWAKHQALDVYADVCRLPDFMSKVDYLAYIIDRTWCDAYQYGREKATEDLDRRQGIP